MLYPITLLTYLLISTDLISSELSGNKATQFAVAVTNQHAVGQVVQPRKS